VLLSVAVRGLGGSYIGMRDKAETEAEKAKYEAYIDECIVLARKIEDVFGVVERKIINDDGSETVLSDNTPRKKKN
jgi:hypothetical protein